MIKYFRQTKVDISLSHPENYIPSPSTSPVQLRPTEDPVPGFSLHSTYWDIPVEAQKYIKATISDYRNNLESII